VTEETQRVLQTLVPSLIDVQCRGGSSVAASTHLAGSSSSGGGGGTAWASKKLCQANEQEVSKD
jgi:hypothetical protein